MGKTETDDVLKIRANFLRKHDYFCGYMSGNLTWTSGYNERKSSVRVEVSTTNGDNYMRLVYTQTDRYSGEKKDFDYKIPLQKTPCHFGGYRYWFTCTLYKRGVYCGRRVSVLYKDGDWFGCRHCYELTYSSRNTNRRYRYHPLFRTITLETKMEELEKTMKRYSYAGRPTKKAARLKKIYRELDYQYDQFKDVNDLL